MEIWKDIPEYEGLYQVSSYGRVRSLDREVLTKNGNLRFYKGAIKSTHIKHSSKKEYLRVSLSKDNKNKNHPVHQLMAITFLGHIPCGMDVVVDHIDNDPSNNNINNLQLVTNRQNSTKDSGRELPVGVTISASKKKPYRARISKGDKVWNLGNYSTPEEASMAYTEKLKEIIYFDNSYLFY